MYQIRPELVYCINVVSKMDKNIPRKHRYCLASPESMTELSIVLGSIFKKRYTFLVFDSLSSFLLYNDLEATERFVHYLTGKLKLAGISGIFTVFDDAKTKELRRVIAPFFDAELNV